MSDIEEGESPTPSVTAASSRPLEIAAALSVTVLGAAMLLGARAIVLRNQSDGIDARWWPGVIGAGVVFMGVWMTIDALRAPITREVLPVSRRGGVQMVITILALAVVLLLWELGVSFLVLGPVYLVGMNWVYGLRTWRSLLLFPGIILILLYLVFQLLLKVPL